MDFKYWMRLISVFIVLGFSTRVGIELATTAINEMRKQTVLTYKEHLMKLSINEQALKLYTPPFKYQHGYIFDSKHSMFSDQGGSEFNYAELIATRVRGWGRIQKLANSEDLQDAVGDHIANALTEYWQTNLKTLNAKENKARSDAKNKLRG